MVIIYIGVLSEEESQLLNNLFEEYHIKFYNISLGILKSHSDAEDAVSESFLKIMNYIDKVNRLPKSKILPYCIVIVKNESFNILQRQKKHSELEDILIKEFNELFDNPIDELFPVGEELNDILHNAVDSLSEADRIFFQLKYAEEKSYREIAQILGTSEASARKRNERIVKKLSQLCRKEVMI